jgi:hypothetical protein
MGHRKGSQKQPAKDLPVVLDMGATQFAKLRYPRLDKVLGIVKTVCRNDRVGTARTLLTATPVWCLNDLEVEIEVRRGATQREIAIKAMRTVPKPWVAGVRSSSASLHLWLLVPYEAAALSYYVRALLEAVWA